MCRGVLGALRGGHDEREATRARRTGGVRPIHRMAPRAVRSPPDRRAARRRLPRRRRAGDRSPSPRARGTSSTRTPSAARAPRRPRARSGSTSGSTTTTLSGELQPLSPSPQNGGSSGSSGSSGAGSTGAGGVHRDDPRRPGDARRRAAEHRRRHAPAGAGRRARSCSSASACACAPPLSASEPPADDDHGGRRGDRGRGRRAGRAPAPGRRRAASRASWARARRRSCAARPAALGFDGPRDEPDVHDRPPLRGRPAARLPPRPVPARRPRRRGPGAARRLPHARRRRVRRVAGDRRAGSCRASRPRVALEHAGGDAATITIDGRADRRSSAFDTATPATVVGVAGARRRAARPAPRTTRPRASAPATPSSCCRSPRAALAEAGVGLGGRRRASASASGPGTFTGLRIGIATARALAQGAGRRGRARSPRCARWRSARADGEPAPVAGGHRRAPRRGVRRRLRRRRRRALLAPAALAARARSAALAELAPGAWLAVGDGAVRFRDGARSGGRHGRRRTIRRRHRVSAAALCRLAAEGPPVPRDALVPEYVRGAGRRVPPPPMSSARRHPPPHLRRPAAGHRDRAARLPDAVVAGDVRARAVASPSGICLAAERRAGRSSATCICSRYDTVWHIMNVAVEPDRRRAGHRHRAARPSCSRAWTSPTPRFTLEVPHVQRGRDRALRAPRLPRRRPAAPLLPGQRRGRRDHVAHARDAARDARRRPERRRPAAPRRLMPRDPRDRDQLRRHVRGRRRRGDGEIRSNVISSQGVHDRYGGVVPEVASRHHLELVNAGRRRRARAAPARRSTTSTSSPSPPGPGSSARCSSASPPPRAIAAARGLPLAPVDHLQGHVAANFLAPAAGAVRAAVPVPDRLRRPHVPGARRPSTTGFTVLGETLDDAAGEAFDKGARLLGLPFPGGPHLRAAGARGRPGRVRVPDRRSASAGWTSRSPG